MKKRSKRKSSQAKIINKEPTPPFWFLDGFVGILALMIYNFVLYILAISCRVGGIIEKMEGTMGYFMLNSFVDFGFNTFQMSIGLILVFVFSFFLGIFIGNFVRKRRNK